jgi:hypothetical protein
MQKWAMGNVQLQALFCAGGGGVQWSKKSFTKGTNDCDVYSCCFRASSTRKSTNDAALDCSTFCFFVFGPSCPYSSGSILAWLIKVLLDARGCCPRGVVAEALQPQSVLDAKTGVCSVKRKQREELMK